MKTNNEIDLENSINRLRDRYAELCTENARLKALTAEMDKTINASQAECRRLKAEVERLTSDIQMEKENEDRLVREWQRANNEVYGLKTQVAALIDNQTRLKAECQARQAENSVLAVECDSLKAEVECLTKAGDAVCESPYLLETDPAVIEWRKAKEGGQP
jgi:chromosome segregation ATPase